MNNENNTAAAILNTLTIPTLDHMPEAVKTAAAAEKQAAELVKTTTAAAEQAQKDIAAAIAAGDIAAAQKALNAQSKLTAELENAKAAHKAAAAELEKAKASNPYRTPAAADYYVAAAAALLRRGETLTARAVATAAIDLMPEKQRPAKLNSPEVIARAVVATLSCIKVEK